MPKPAADIDPHDPLVRTFVSPARYIQGAGAIGVLGEHLLRIGQRPLIIADDNVWSITEGQVRESFDGVGLPLHRERFVGPVTTDEITRLASLARAQGSDVVVGLGGGSAIDAAKAAGDEAKVRWASVPTTASTDAPTTGFVVLYNAAGESAGARRLIRSPDLVLVDSQLIANAPADQFIAGIADALSTWLEARLSYSTSSRVPAGGHASMAALALAELSWTILHEHALAAIDAVRRHEVNEDVERVIEANTLLSGLGFESGGLAAAHAVHDGLTMLPQTHGLQHGEKVNIGSITQLILEGRPAEEIDAFIVFTASLGLPTSLTEIGLSPHDVAELRAVAEVATGPQKYIHNLPFAVTVDRVVEALLEVETSSLRARLAVGSGAGAAQSGGSQ